MYKLTKKILSSSVVIAIFFSSSVIIADNANPSDISIKKQELIKYLLPTSKTEFLKLTEITMQPSKSY